jgi:hypothetical protein
MRSAGHPTEAQEDAPQPIGQIARQSPAAVELDKDNVRRSREGEQVARHRSLPVHRHRPGAMGTE